MNLCFTVIVTFVLVSASGVAVITCLLFWAHLIDCIFETDIFETLLSRLDL